jgi:hypothetical protein
MPLATPLSTKRQLGYRLFTGEDLNKIAIAVNQLSLSGAQTIGTLTTVGAGTLTAVLLAGGIIQRSGPTGVFTDTTDTGTAIDAAIKQAAITGTAWQVTYQNTTNFAATLAGGTGVTASGTLVVPANSTATLLLSRTGTGTYTLVGLSASTPGSSTGGTNSIVATADNGTTQTLTAAMITGGNLTYHTSTGGTTPSLTLPLGTAMDTALPNAPIGASYTLRIINTNSGTATIVTDTGWTLTGTLTLATNTTRDFVITRTAAGTYTGVSVGTGTTS